jgi:hypothetical protein
MFLEHTARRYYQRALQNFKMIEWLPTCTTSLASTQLKTISQLKTIGWTCFRFGLIAFTIFGSVYLCLYFFQRAECRRYQNNEIVIDVNAD